METRQMNNAIVLSSTQMHGLLKSGYYSYKTRKDPASQGSPPRAKTQYRALSFWVTATAIDN